MLKCSNVPACIHRPGVFPKPAGLTVSLQKHYSGSQRRFWHTMVRVVRMALMARMVRMVWMVDKWTLVGKYIC